MVMKMIQGHYQRILRLFFGDVVSREQVSISTLWNKSPISSFEEN